VSDTYAQGIRARLGNSPQITTPWPQRAARF